MVSTHGFPLPCLSILTEANWEIVKGNCWERLKKMARCKMNLWLKRGQWIYKYQRTNIWVVEITCSNRTFMKWLLRTVTQFFACKCSYSSYLSKAVIFIASSQTNLYSCPIKAGLNLKFCEKKFEVLFLTQLLSKVCFESFCYCKYKARFLKTSYFVLWEKISWEGFVQLR